jgi:excisionase family DNA binding protein
VGAERSLGAMMGGRLLTVTEAAEVLRCSVATVKRRIRTGALPTYRDGRLVRIREDDLRRYVIERICRRAQAAEPGRAAGRSLQRGERLWD